MMFSTMVLCGIASLMAAAISYHILRTLKCQHLYSKSGIHENLKRDWLHNIMMMFWLCVFAPVTEELFFRMILFKIVLALGFSLGSVILITSVLFALVHCNDWPQFPVPQLLSGIILGMVFVMGGLWASIVAHITHNFLIGAIVLTHAAFTKTKE